MRLLHWRYVVLLTIFSVSVHKVFSQTEANEPITTRQPATPQPSVTTRRTQRTTQPLLAETCGVSSAIQSKIIGGRDAQNCQFPWIVGVDITEDNNNNHWCGGTILDNMHILTAAHCAINRIDATILAPRTIRVLVGSSYRRELEERSIQRIDVSPMYNITNKDYDIAILTLSNALVFNDCIRPICLPEIGDAPENSIECTIAGWGVTENPDRFESPQPVNNLQMVDIPIVPNDLCATAYNTRTIDYVNERRMCAGDYENGGIDSCVGDSGGPLMCQVSINSQIRYVQHGIVSFGRVCGNPRSPGVYTRVAHPDIRNFIRSITRL